MTMHRAFWIAAALALAAPAYSPAQGTSETPAESTKPKTGKKAATAKKKTKGTAGATDAAKKGAAAAKKDDPEAASRASMKRARAVFMFAVDSCQQQAQRCDPALRDDAEARFMDACQACGTTEKCEAERTAIREGTATRTGDPCAK
jgi:hypothetical protein